MKLKVIDQLHISSVSADTLRPGQEIDVDTALGEELLKKHPAAFAAIGAKKAPAPKNKAGAAPANKSQG